MQRFGAKSGASAAKPHASRGLRAKNFARKGPALAGPQPSGLKIDLKALMLLFRKLYKFFVGLEWFRIYCDLKFKHPIFRWIQIFPVNLMLTAFVQHKCFDPGVTWLAIAVFFWFLGFLHFSGNFGSVVSAASRRREWWFVPQNQFPKLQLYIFRFRPAFWMHLTMH